MTLKTLKLGLFTLALCSIGFVNAQKHEGKEHRNPEELFKKLDVNTDGMLSLEEFKSRKKREEVKEEMINGRFKTLDADNDGNLSLEEFVSRKEMTKEELISKRFSDMDSDGNGTIDLSEYKAFVESHEKGRKKRKRRRH